MASSSFCGTTARTSVAPEEPMNNRALARRLEDLEAELLPVTGEPIIMRVDFVERDGTVVEHKEFTVRAPPPTSHGPQARRRRR